MNNIQQLLRDALTACHLREGFFGPETGYCLDAPEIFPAGSVVKQVHTPVGLFLFRGQ